MAKIAFDDFRYFKITNKSVIALILVYLAFAISKNFNGFSMDLLAGGILFALGFVFWLLKMMGAGDAKLYFPVGLLVSWTQLLPYTIYLVVFSVILLLLLKLPIPLPFRHTMAAIRFDEIRKGKSVPYAVPITFAAMAVLLPRALSI